MARLRTWAEWDALTGDKALNAAERRLADHCKAGKPCHLGDGTRPEGPDPARTIRADFLRYLILGGCPAWPVDAVGVRIIGAYVPDTLVLDFDSATGATIFVDCRFAEKISAVQARFKLLNLSGTALPGLKAHSAEITGAVVLTEGFHANGEVSLAGAKIGGQLMCRKGRFENPKGLALNAQGAEITGHVFLDDGFHANGEVSLAGAKIGGQLVCRKGRFETPDGDALNAQGAEITGNVFLRGGFHASGAVNLNSATIGGQLVCDKGRFENPDGHALNAQGAEITGDVFLDDGFHANGEVSLAGAKIGGQLGCGKGRFENPDGDALNAHSAEITGDVFLDNGFHATGAVSLNGAKIDRQLECSGGRFENRHGHALQAQRLRVEQSFFWRRMEVPEGRISLAAAHVGDLMDDPDSWPGTGRLILDGFTYDRIAPFAFIDAPRRLAWLSKGDRSDGNFFPQPYSQLAKVLREMGHDREARRVMMEKERRVRQHARQVARIVPNGDLDIAIKSMWVDIRNLLRWLWDLFALRAITGYGYAPFRSVVALSILFFVGTFVADRAYTEGSCAPNSDVILTSPGWTDLANDPAVANPAEAWSAAKAPGRDWETFNRYAYAFDVVVPILTLGQTAAWAPSTTRGPWGWNLWWARWVLSSLGWLVTALGAAAITGIIRRE